MSKELTMAAQQALACMRGLQQHLGPDICAIEADALERALTQRPAAQTEREAFERAALAKWGQLDFERSEVEPEMHYNQRLDDAWIGFGFAVAWLRASLPAPQQATPDSACKVCQGTGDAPLVTKGESLCKACYGTGETLTQATTEEIAQVTGYTIPTPDEWKGHDPDALAAAQAKGADK